MAYRIAGIDVHKKMLAVVVSNLEVDGGFQFERRRWRQPRTTAIAGRMAARARGRGNCRDSVD
jgi:hypothetical protein